WLLTPMEETSHDAAASVSGKHVYETPAPARDAWRRRGAHTLALACGACDGPAAWAVDRGGACHLVPHLVRPRRDPGHYHTVHVFVCPPRCPGETYAWQSADPQPGGILVREPRRTHLRISPACWGHLP